MRESRAAKKKMKNRVKKENKVLDMDGADEIKMISEKNLDALFVKSVVEKLYSRWHVF